MDALLLRILFVLACLPTGVATMVMILLSPRPATPLEHARGAARFMIVAGCLFSTAAVASGAHPKWYIVVLVLGFGFLVSLHAKEIYQQAHELEKARKATA